MRCTAKPLGETLKGVRKDTGWGAEGGKESREGERKGQWSWYVSTVHRWLKER